MSGSVSRIKASLAGIAKPKHFVSWKESGAFAARKFLIEVAKAYLASGNALAAQERLSWIAEHGSMVDHQRDRLQKEIYEVLGDRDSLRPGATAWIPTPGTPTGAA
ncbi:MAG: hypothetical protein ACI80V_002130 [Rhodothermales bacterium]